LAYLFNGKKDWTIKKIITLDFKKKNQVVIVYVDKIKFPYSPTIKSLLAVVKHPFSPSTFPYKYEI
jgi:hypothetical protein